MLKMLTLSLFCLAALTATVLAADGPTAQERLVGGTFKNLARAYVATANIADLKAKNIQRIESMHAEWFRLRYAEVYEVAGSLPQPVREKYGIKQFMTRADAVSVIEKLDKKALYEMIDKLPEQVIAQKFFAEMEKKNADGKPKNILDSVRGTWDSLVRHLNRPVPGSVTKH
ncbi:MAG: hypothetical protein HGA80_02765 [Candidatus Omnitrophica bacterium]|nr:hypothetical protein [Candidatus Omnitrophota bacterium]